MITKEFDIQRDEVIWTFDCNTVSAEITGGKYTHDILHEKYNEEGFCYN